MSLIESGELTELHHRWWYKNTQCPQNENKDNSRNELSLSNVAGIFFILIGGLLLSLFVALCEFCLKKSEETYATHHHYHHQQQQQHMLNQQQHPLQQQQHQQQLHHLQHNNKQMSDTLKSKLATQASREYDNGAVGVSFSHIII